MQWVNLQHKLLRTGQKIEIWYLFNKCFFILLKSVYYLLIYWTKTYYSVFFSLHFRDQFINFYWIFIFLRILGFLYWLKQTNDQTYQAMLIEWWRQQKKTAHLMEEYYWISLNNSVNIIGFLMSHEYCLLYEHSLEHISNIITIIKQYK